MAAGETVITYGPITLYNVTTVAFVQELVRDELSGTDPMFFKYNIRVIGYAHGRALPVTFGMAPTTGDGSSGNQLSQMRNLFTDRLSFEMRTGVIYDQGGNVTTPGVVLLHADPAITSGSTNINLKDCSNGPRVKIMSANSIIADNMIRVELEFEICQVNCANDGSTSNTSGVLNNRWSCTDEIDRNFYTTRTFTGRLRCSSSQVNPNSFRSFVVPPLQQGMRREHISIQVTEDSLNLAYTVTDREVAFSPPSPATTWDFRHTERYDVVGQLGWFTDVEVTLGGDRQADKKKLIAIASAICDAKFSGGNKAANNFRVLSLAITDEYGDDKNLIHLRATAQRLDPNNGPAVKGVQAKFLGQPIAVNDLGALSPGYDSRNSRDGRTGDNLEIRGPIPLAGAFASFLQSPCVNQYAISSGIRGTDSTPSTGSLPSVSAYVVTELQTDNSLTNYSSDNYVNAYVYWQLESHYQTTTNRAHCPIAVTPSSSSSSSSSGGINPASVAINLAPPLTQRTIRYSAERIGILPTIPNPVDTFADENEITCTLLSNTVSSQSPQRSADAKQSFVVSGEIVYGLSQALSSVTNPVMRLGLNSWEKNTPLYAQIFPQTTNAV